MAGKRSLTSLHLKSLLDKDDLDSHNKKLEPKLDPPVRSFLPNSKVTAHRTQRLWKALGASAHPDLLDPWTSDQLESFDGNIENFIGSVKLPLGVAGPLRVNGLFAQGDYPLPLATSEAALVMDQDGRVWLMGRASAKIQLNEKSLYPFGVECAAMSHPEVERCALIFFENQVTLFVEGPDNKRLRTQLLEKLKELSVESIRFTPLIPVDKRHNAKIDYSELQKLVE